MLLWPQCYKGEGFDYASDGAKTPTTAPARIQPEAGWDTTSGVRVWGRAVEKEMKALSVVVGELRCLSDERRLKSPHVAHP